jgi:hypothetical protein
MGVCQDPSNAFNTPIAVRTREVSVPIVNRSALVTRRECIATTRSDSKRLNETSMSCLSRKSWAPFSAASAMDTIEMEVRA